jgi:hypothetical protein
MEMKQDMGVPEAQWCDDWGAVVEYVVLVVVVVVVVLDAAADTTTTTTLESVTAIVAGTDMLLAINNTIDIRISIIVINRMHCCEYGEHRGRR